MFDTLVNFLRLDVLFSFERCRAQVLRASGTNDVKLTLVFGFPVIKFTEIPEEGSEGLMTVFKRLLPVQTNR